MKLNKMFDAQNVFGSLHKSLRFTVKTGLVAASLCAAHAANAAPLNFSVFTDPHPVMSGGTIGFTYAGNKFVGSVQKDGTNVLYSTDLTGGNVQVFAPGVSLASNNASEHYVASSLGLGGFASRDIYVANGNGVMHITNDGSSSNSFVSGLSGSVRGILFDPVGSFSHDMLVTTSSGDVYRVNSGGSASLLASIGADTEGLDIAPAGFGSFAGQLVVASEGTGQINAIDTAGNVTNLGVAISGGPEELTFVPLNLGSSGNPVEGFYGSNYSQNVLKADASEFTGYLGDAIVTSEFGHQVSRIHWNGTSFEVDNIGTFPNQPEDGLFVTADIIRGGAVPLPPAAWLFGSGLIGLIATTRRQSRRAETI